MEVKGTVARRPVDLLVGPAAQVVTPPSGDGRPPAGPAQGRLVQISNGAVAVRGKDIVDVGPYDEVVARVDPASTFDARGCTVLPGFVDPHTHLCFAGWRAEEFERRLAGASYQEILATGGGILDTVRHTRAASEVELACLVRARLLEVLGFGTTTVEIKSGYGLTTSDELKMLRAIRRAADPGDDLDGTWPGGELVLPEVVPTFLGAHAVPAEYRDDPDAYVDRVIDEMLPAVAREGLAQYVDVFCEVGVFDLEQTRRIALAAQELGFRIRLHVDEMAPLGGAGLAAELGAISADHLLHVREEDIPRLRAAGTVATLLPGTAFFLRESYAPARKLIEAGVPLALATDYNPGTHPAGNMALVMAIACIEMGLTPAEALVASTLGAAHALERGNRVGSIEPGKQADLVILEAPSYEHLAYRLGTAQIVAVVKAGKIVPSGGWQR